MNFKVEISLVGIFVAAWLSMLFFGMIGHQFSDASWFTPYWMHFVGWLVLACLVNIRRVK